MKPQRLVLGSSSVWRVRILERLGMPFEVIAPDIDEKAIRHSNPQTLALRVSMAKDEAVLAKVTGPVTIVCADTVVVFQGEIREKPRVTRPNLASSGAQVVEDPDMATCVADIIGDRDSIMGLPLGVTMAIIQDLGYRLP